MSLPRLKRKFQSVCRVAHMCPFFYCPMFENNVFIFVFLLFFYTYFISLFVHKYCSACCFVLFCDRPLPPLCRFPSIFLMEPGTRKFLCCFFCFHGTFHLTGATKCAASQSSGELGPIKSLEK